MSGAQDVDELTVVDVEDLYLHGLFSLLSLFYFDGGLLFLSDGLLRFRYGDL